MNNTETVLEKAADIIKNNRHVLEIDGISYIKLDGHKCHSQGIFYKERFIANLDRNAVKVEPVHMTILFTTAVLSNTPSQ